jgi:hypothetical protein
VARPRRSRACSTTSGAYLYNDDAGTTAKGTLYDVLGVADPLGGLSWSFGGPSANNQDVRHRPHHRTRLAAALDQLVQRLTRLTSPCSSGIGLNRATTCLLPDRRERDQDLR